MIRLKRVYDPPSDDDGVRILVERLWPRGLTKGKARIDLWLKEVSPSPELRKWFSHDDTKWEEFSERYRKELDGNIASIRKIIEMASKGDVTLVFASKDAEHNSTVLVREYALKLAGSPP
jgi:uncharacterized protein YeaO (DUF488 family)